MNKSKLLIALIGLFATGAAFAGGTVRQAPVEAPAEVAPAPAPAPYVAPAPAPAPVVVAPAFVPSWYVGLGVGRTKLTGGLLGGSDTSEKVFAGYRFHPNFAAEATYLHMGGGANSVNLDALGILPVGYNVDLFAKVGIADTRFSDLGSKTGANYGVGAAYHFNRNWSARVEAEQTNKATDFGDKANTYSISAQYNF